MMLSMLAATLLVFSPEATLQGTVRTEGTREPVPNATVTIAQLNRTAIADAKGYYVISGVPEGSWRVAASAPGYATHAVTVVAGPAGTVRLDFELTVRPLELAPVDVEAEADVRVVSGVGSGPPTAGPPAARLTGTSIRRLPGIAEVDVLRALQVLPAVGAISDYSTALYVRGGSADQNLITLDGIPLFNPYHVGGIFSAIGADAVSSVDVWAGAFPASSSGDRLSSIVQIHTRDGARDRVRTSGGIGLLSTSLTVDGPLGERGTFLFTGRRTYIDAVSDAAYGLGLTDHTLPYGFTDAYLKASHDVGGLGSISVSGYLDLESVRIPERMRRLMDVDLQFGWGARMLALTYRQPLGASFLLQVRAGYSGFSGDFDAWEYEGGDCFDIVPCLARDTNKVVQAHTRNRDLIAGADLTWFTLAHTLRAGVQLDSYLLDHAKDVLADDDDLFPLTARTDRPTTIAAFIEDRWRVADALEMRAGIRLLDAGSLGTAWMPRIGLRWQATRQFAFSAGAGKYVQPVRSFRNDESLMSSFIAYDMIAAPPDSIGMPHADDIVLGAQWADNNTLVRLDAYSRRTENLLLPPRAEIPSDAPILVADTFRIGSARNRGIELMAAHRRGIAELSLAYAFSKAELRSGADVFPPRYERRHELDANLAFTWPRTTLSSRLVVASGQPYTAAIGQADTWWIFDPEQQRWVARETRILLGEHNDARMPGYLRLDLALRRSFQKTWFGRQGTITPYIQILNVLGTKNVLTAEPNGFGIPELVYTPQLPFLPTFGLEWRF